MITAPSLTRDLVLVGGGHTHALVLRRLAMQPRPPELRISLISPATHTPYSGMLPGLIAGHYRFEDVHIDLLRLCQWADVRFIAASVEGLDPQARRLQIAGRPDLHYDWLSLDIGAQPDLDSVPGAREHAVPVKPVASLWSRWQQFRATAAGSQATVAVVGGGAGGVEMVLAMAHAVPDPAPRFSLYCAEADILSGYSAGARAAARRALKAAGIAVHGEHRVSRVDSDQLHFASGQSAPADLVFWCTGAAPAPWIAASGLQTDRQGFLAVHDSLQSPDDPRIFAAGDIATQLRHPRPKAGVYAVRQAPTLAHNLLASVQAPDGQARLHAHRPQQQFLSLLSLGERRATANRGPLFATGAWVWRWKDRIDQNFMRRFRDLPPRRVMQATPATQPAPCGGCGAKVGPQALHTALAALRARFPAHCLPGGEALGDVARLPHSNGLLQSIDSLRSLVSDPFQMGQITAQHALSDLYASGASPHSALAHLVLPFASGTLQQRDLEQVLAGMLEVLAAADCPLLGGHSMQGPELQLGLVVNGHLPTADSALRRPQGGRAGDALLLTKPLGTGLIFAAQMQLQADGRDVQSAIRSMLRSNAEASAIATSQQARAATDVTGFGLLGHLHSMLGPGIGAELEVAQIPVLPGARKAQAAGIASTLLPANRAALAAYLHGDFDAATRDLLLDPQTSGGLLLAMPAATAAACLQALRDSGAEAACIGHLCADPHGRIRLSGAPDLDAV